MSVRSSMANLIRRLRQMCEAGPDDYTLDGVTYWTDDELQARLDETRSWLTDVPLAVRPSYENSEYVYKLYEVPRTAGNAIEGGFRVYDSTGVDVDPDTYSWYDRDLSISFAADTTGIAYYADLHAYNLQKAAQGIWLDKAAHMHMAINFSADGHRFDREALYKHCMEMAGVYGYQPGGVSGTSLHSGRLVRTDVVSVSGKGYL